MGRPAQTSADDTVPRIRSSTENCMWFVPNKWQPKQVKRGVDRITNSAQSAASALRKSAGEVENDKRRDRTPSLAQDSRRNIQRPSRLPIHPRNYSPSAGAHWAMIGLAPGRLLYVRLWWLCACLWSLAAAFLVRLFMVEHDCSHHAL